MNELRAAITSSLQEVGIPVNLFHTSSIATAKKGHITSMDLRAVKGYLGIGMVPVLGGDVVYDTEMGFSIGSGDQVAVILAKELGATDLVFATDVAGVYDSDPKSVPGARLIHDLRPSQLEELISAAGGKSDASGALKGKLLSLSTLEPNLAQGLRLTIMSMMKPGKLSALLRGSAIEATQIRP